MKKIPAINGLRGIAILTVMGYHMWYPMVGARISTPFLSIGDTTLLHYGFLQSGQMAVYLFFIISGFVLALPYAMGTRTMASKKDAWQFYTKRASRILPLYYVHLAIILTMYNRLPKEIPMMLRDIVLMGTATFHFVPSMWFPTYNGVLWSIGSEIWFCVLMPGILWAIRRYGLVRTVVTVGFCSILMQWWGTVTVGGGVNYITDNVIGDAIYFCLGIAAAYAHIRHRFRRPFLLAATGAVLLATAFLLQDRVMVGAWHLKPTITPIITAVFAVGCTALMLGLIHSRSRVLSAIFSNRPLQLVGMMSYSLYLWHPYALPIFTAEVTSFNFVRMCLALSLLGWLSYRYVEFGWVKNVHELLPKSRQSTHDTSPIPVS